MARTRALVRQWTLLRVLSQHADGLSIEDMARQTSVNTRTIRRDLKLFVEAGIPLRETIAVRNKKSWRIDQHGAKVLSNHSTDECLAVLAAHLILQPIAGTRFHDALSRCRDRALATMPAVIRKRAEERLNALESTPRLAGCTPPLLQNVEALWDMLTAGTSVKPACTEPEVFHHEVELSQARQA